MRGLHLMAELFGCCCDDALLDDATRLAALCRATVGETGLVVVGEAFHGFEPRGATGVVLLAESHLAVHTWPECRAVTLDAYVCNVGTDNRAGAEALVARLLAAFRPQCHELRRIERGALAALVLPAR